MDPEGLLALSFVMGFLLFVYLLIRSKHKHELAKLDRLAEGRADRSLTTTELENMVKDIVREATEPLEARVDEMSRRLGSSATTPLLDIDEEADSDREEREKTLGRRTRA